MNVIILILAVSICIAGAFLAAFLWSVKDGQFDDTESPAQRMLFGTSSDSYRSSSATSNLMKSSDELKHSKGNSEI